MPDAEAIPDNVIGEYARLSAADRRAIEQRLSPVERARMKALLQRAAPPRAKKQPDPPPLGAAFHKCSATLAAHLAAFADDRGGGEARVTEATLRAIKALATPRASKPVT